MWIFVKDYKIVATSKHERTAKVVAKRIRGQGYLVAYADNLTEFLDPEVVWDMDG